MGTISRIRVTLSGAQGLPGVSTFYALDPVTAVVALRAFYFKSAARFPQLVNIQVEGAGDVLNEANGEAVASWSTVTPAVVDCNGAAEYLAPAGMSITWETGVFIGGRRVRGRTFMVPFVSGAFEADGTPTFTNVDGLRLDGAALIASNPGNLLVYHRETSKGAEDGTGVPISSCLVSDKVAILRSRRD